jgi:ParB family chromosome partitioning protein
MHVPPMRHLDGAACPPADAWNRIAGLFEADTEQEACTEPSTSKANAA